MQGSGNGTKNGHPSRPKIPFEKMKFKVLHYIQDDFIRQRQGLSKDQASMFKCFVIY